MRVLFNDINKDGCYNFREIEIENSLQALQDRLGGYIETITISRDIVAIVNEEGRILHEKGDARFGPSMFLGGQIIYGPVIFAGVRDDEFADVPIPYPLLCLILRESFPRDLFNWRIINGFTLKEAAQILGVNYTTYCYWEAATKKASIKNWQQSVIRLIKASREIAGVE